MPVARRIAVDVGGTFTDVVSIDPESRSLVHAKALTTHPDPTAGLLAALGKLGGGGCRYVGFGTTLATNTVLTRSGARVALITTAGFRDVLEIRRTHREKLFDLYEEIALPLVPRQRRFEVTERTAADGTVAIDLAEDEVRDAARRVRECGATSIAVCLLFSFRNPRHEQRVREILSEELPELAGDISLSSDVLRLHREFERTSTTVLNAYLTPLMRTYLRGLQRDIESSIGAARLRVMQSTGGLVRPERAAELPILTLLSGPAGGAIGSAGLGRLVDTPNLLALDMGGTSTDVTGVLGGVPDTRVDFSIGGYAVACPTIDVHTIGAGGGSIARVDEFGRLSVGPGSAGSDPGPACYGRGGAEPTLTDAQLVLGIYDPAFSLGGEIVPDRALAREAVETRVAAPLGLDVMEAAAGIVRLVDTHIVHALRAVSVERGRDPRDFALVACGGAGPAHAVGVARQLGIGRVVVPPVPGCSSALGILDSDVRHEVVEAFPARLQGLDPRELSTLVDHLVERADSELILDGVSESARECRLALDLRYVGQAYEMTVPVGTLRVSAQALGSAIADFHEAHRRRYGHALDDDLVEVVNVRVTGVGATEKVELRLRRREDRSPEPRSRRVVYLPDGGEAEVPVHVRGDLRAGDTLASPCVVHQIDATVFLPPGCTSVVHSTGSLIIEI